MSDIDLEIDAALELAQRAVSGEALERVLRDACQPMLDRAISLAPNKSGNLKRHIQLRTKHSNASASAILEVKDSGVGGDVREAIFSEFGTSHQPAKPFMRPAFEASKDGVLNAVGQHLLNAIGE